MSTPPRIHASKVSPFTMTPVVVPRHARYTSSFSIRFSIRVLFSSVEQCVYNSLTRAGIHVHHGYTYLYILWVARGTKGTRWATFRFRQLFPVSMERRCNITDCH